MLNADSLCCRSAYDFDNFFCDLRLAPAIHYQRQLIVHVAGVAGRRVHRGHAGGVFGGHGLQQRAKNLDADVLWQNALEKLVVRLLVDGVDRRRSEAGGCLIDAAGIYGTHPNASRLRRFQSLLAFLFRSLFGHGHVDCADLFDGQEEVGDEALRDDRLEFVEENVDAVNFVAGVAGNHTLAKRGREIVFDLAENSDMVAYDSYSTGSLRGGFGTGADGRDARRSIGDRVASSHEVAALASDAFDVNIDILIGLRLDEFRSHLQDIGVERPVEPLISGDDDQKDVVFRSLG